jgi:hypothetical protein
MSCKDQALSASLYFEEFGVSEEINITIVGMTGDECDGYKCYSSLNDVNNEGNLKKTSSNL